MSNFLDTGAVLPFGLLSENTSAAMAGFNKSYNNCYLRVGVVIKSYDVSDENNRSKLTTEYDVSVFEQNQDKGATTIVYKNCMTIDSFGSIADFVDRTFRKMEEKTTKGYGINLSGQNGAIVLLLCQDGMSDKGIIIGGFPHPDRQTTIKNNGPRFEGEFNGINISVESDGSAKLNFNGATDNSGRPVDPSQAGTILSIEKNGSVQIEHKTITLRLDRGGEVSLKTTGNVNVNCKEATVTATGNATVEGKQVLLGAGAAEAVIKGDTFAQLYNNHTHIGNLGALTGPPTKPMDPSLSKKVKTE